MQVQSKVSRDISTERSFEAQVVHWVGKVCALRSIEPLFGDNAHAYSSVARTDFAVGKTIEGPRPRSSEYARTAVRSFTAFSAAC